MSGRSGPPEMALAPPRNPPPPGSAIEPAGQKLRRARERLGLRFRDVEEASTRIARARQNDEFVVALSRLADIENKGTLPTIFRIYSLSAIYRLDYAEVLGWYGVPLAELPADAASLRLESTHPIGLSPTDDAGVQVPISLDPGADLSKTVFLSRIIQKWGTLPAMMLRRLDLRSLRYGFVGTADWSMFPILPPGSLVVIDDSRRRVQSSGWTSEFDRPIYFLEHREGFLCGWCSLSDDRLTVFPHPSSAYPVQSFEFPREIEIVGQVVHVAITLDPETRRGL